jgi:linoleate 10R-lipoxygenase
MVQFLTRDYGFMLTFDNEERHSRDRHMCMTALWGSEEKYKKFEKFYSETTARLIHERSFQFDTSEHSPKYVDIVKQVINATSMRWACDWITGLNLKNAENPRGIFTEQEVYKMFSVLFSCVFQNILPENGAFLRATAKKVGDFINDTIENSLKQCMPGLGGGITRLQSQLLGKSIAGKPCEPFLTELVNTGRPIDELVASINSMAVGSSANYAQACTQVIDFYLDDDRTVERAEIIKLVKRPRDDKDAERKLIGYIKEAQRLAPQFPGLFRVNKTAHPIKIEEGVVEPGKDPEIVTIQPGQQVFCSFYKAQTNVSL